MSNLLNAVQTFVSENKQEVAIGAIGTTAGIALGAGTALALTSKKRRKTSKKRKSSKKSKRKSKRNKRKYYPERKGRKYSRRKIRMTKSGQPYIILASGKARFISKSSARRSKRLKGGRY
jgi:hypothetical protein